MSSFNNKFSIMIAAEREQRRLLRQKKKAEEKRAAVKDDDAPEVDNWADMSDEESIRTSQMSFSDSEEDTQIEDEVDTRAPEQPTDKNLTGAQKKKLSKKKIPQTQQKKSTVNDDDLDAYLAEHKEDVDVSPVNEADEEAKKKKKKEKTAAPTKKEITTPAPIPAAPVIAAEPIDREEALRKLKAKASGGASAKLDPLAAAKAEALKKKEAQKKKEKKNNKLA